LLPPSHADHEQNERDCTQQRAHAVERSPAAGEQRPKWNLRRQTPPRHGAATLRRVRCIASFGGNPFIE